MKAQNRWMGIVVTALLLPSAFAETAPKREAVRIDFNKMIDANSSDKNDLEKSVINKMDKQAARKGNLASDKKKVVDLIDVEVNLSKERPLVDRRFNSVGDIHVATEFRPKAEIQ